MFSCLRNLFGPSPPKECRICFSSDDAKFVKPCFCKGTIGYVHNQCLLTWIEISRNERCTTCGIEFRRKYRMEEVDGNYVVITSFINQ